MKISHSRTELYSLCPAKYQYKYIQKLEADKTFSALLFGSAIDKALNYVLTRTKRSHIVHPDTAKKIFHRYMSNWNAQNEFVYFKNECPNIKDFESLPSDRKQDLVWSHLSEVGRQMIDTYITEVLPKFKRIVSVQTKKEIPNNDGDILILITDFVAELHDGRRVVFDNKTTSDVKKSYPKTSVKKSQQLAIYSEFEDTKLAGYIALQKQPKDGRIIWDMIVDEVPEDQVQIAFDKVDTALRAIKREDFPKNEKSCFKFGRLCEYSLYCRYNNMNGLIKRS